MSLREYGRKRRFGETPEPPADEHRRRRRAKRPIFVVQLHHARARHYDFRLEVDGALKSWAVPKGPSLRPGEKRLAVEVEDHPLSYATFAGDIPAGHYGAGHVDIFDHGTWTPEGEPLRALAEGLIDAVGEFGVKAYDVAPLALLVEEAGGRFTAVTGENGPWHGSALASNGTLHDELLSRIGR